MDPATHPHGTMPREPAADTAPPADLFPHARPGDQPVFIAGRWVLVREYWFGEGMAVEWHAAALLLDMEALLAQRATEVGTSHVQALFLRHRDLVLELIARSIIEPSAKPMKEEELRPRIAVLIEWLQGLSQLEGDLLLMTWWNVCSDFFWRRLIRGVLEARQLTDAEGAADVLASASVGGFSASATDAAETA